MPELKSIYVTSVNVAPLSRHDLLKWVNDSVNGNYAKIEELCSGVAYCQLMEQITPGVVGIEKVKINAKSEHEFLFNLRLFQSSFAKIKVEKSVPMDRLVKARFQDNFEFLQWFKKFYDSHSSGENKENVTSNKVTPTSTANRVRKATSTPNLTPSGVPNQQKKVTPTTSQQRKNSKKSPANDNSNAISRSASPSSLVTMKETADSLKENIAILKQEKDFYFNKLTNIETLCNEEALHNEEERKWATRILEILYATEEGTEPAPNA